MPKHWDDGIAKYEVSEDGLNWRSFDPAKDRGRLLHKRIVFAPPAEHDQLGRVHPRAAMHASKAGPLSP